MILDKESIQRLCKKAEKVVYNEEKYNKILKYFDTGLDNLELDWEKLIKSVLEIPNNDYYKKVIFEYATKRRKL